MKILIGTPCYGGLCHVAYLSSLMNTQNYFRKNKDLNVTIDVTFTTNDSLVTRARNTIVARFLADKSYSYLLFIDSDIKWEPNAIELLLKEKKGVIGGAYPKKAYRWERISNGTMYKDLSELKACMTDYVVSYTENKMIDGLIPVDYIGTGFLMVSRYVLEKMYKLLPETHYTDNDGDVTKDENEWLYNLFDTGVHEFREGDKRLLSEDYLFCQRVKDRMKERIWLHPKVSLTHIGQNYYEGNFEKTITHF